MDETIWIRHIRPILYRRRGDPERAIAGIKRMTPEEQEALFHVLRDFEQEALRSQSAAKAYGLLRGW